MQEQTRNCPTCGQAVEMGAAYCGYCGHDFSGNVAGSHTPNGPMTSPGRVPGLGRLRNLGLFLTLATIGATIAIFVVVGQQVDRIFDDVNVDVPTFQTDVPDFGGPDSIDGKGAYKSARALVSAMNENGFSCKEFDLIVKNQTSQAATCYAEDDYLSIQVFYDTLSFDSVLDGYKTLDLHVAYGTNWIVISQTSKSARGVAKSTGGKTI